MHYFKNLIKAELKSHSFKSKILITVSLCIHIKWIDQEKKWNKQQYYIQHSYALLPRFVLSTPNKTQPDKATKVIDDVEVVDNVYMDFSKVFDKAPRGGLIHKIKMHVINKDSAMDSELAYW